MPTRRRELYTHHLPALVWLSLVTLALAVPGDRADLPEWWPRILHFHALDKVIHGLLFLVAGLLLARSLRCLSRVARPALAACALLVAYGAATEVVQHLLTTRSGEAADFAADAAGAAAGAAFSAAVAARRDRPPAAGAEARR